MTILRNASRIFIGLYYYKIYILELMEYSTLSMFKEEEAMKVVSSYEALDSSV